MSREIAHDQLAAALVVVCEPLAVFFQVPRSSDRSTIAQVERLRVLRRFYNLCRANNVGADLAPTVVQIRGHHDQRVAHIFKERPVPVPPLPGDDEGGAA